MKNNILTAKNPSLKTQVFHLSLFYTLALIIVFNLITSAYLYHLQISNGKTFLKQKNNSLAYFIEGFFNKFYATLGLLSKNPKVINAYKASPEERKEALKLYKSIQQFMPEINYLFSGYKNKFLLINDYTPAPGFDPTIRPWYIAAIKAYPKASDGIAYREYITKEWLVSISKALVNEKGEITGVIAIDSSVDHILKLLKSKQEEYKTAHSYVIKTDGTIIIHPDENLLEKNIYKILSSSISFNQKEGEISYTFNGISKLGYYTKLEKINWIVVTVVNKNELLYPVIKQIFVNSLIISVFSLLFGWFISFWINSNIVIPLTQLRLKLSYLSQGNFSKSSFYSYPSNEIGFIASEIEKLTSQSLLKKTLRLEKLNKALQKLVEIDYLTGIFNRRKIMKELKALENSAKLRGETFSVILLDVDYFKNINDTYGHDVGDKVLKHIAKIIKSTIRATDMYGRWGGEEFIIVCPQTPLEKAYQLAERLRKTVKNSDFPVETKVTISAGVSEFNPSKDLTHLLKEADFNLYRAKRAGRNRAVK